LTVLLKSLLDLTAGRIAMSTISIRLLDRDVCSRDIGKPYDIHIEKRMLKRKGNG